ncbi:MAG: hypothetical protein IPJ84_15995 [Bdellovibrionales bacterium]|nr:hypothetical protein [Bdellovibrionales bacterium]
MFKTTIPRLMAIHFLLNVLILSIAGISHRSRAAESILTSPLFLWPIWFFFLGQGWKRALSVSFATVLSFAVLVVFLIKDENLIGRRRFATQLGQVYLVQQFDFDNSKELSDKIYIEKPLPFGFIKTIKSYFPKNSSIGRISEAKVHGTTFVVKGDWGSYFFKYNGDQLELVQ